MRWIGRSERIVLAIAACLCTSALTLDVVDTSDTIEHLLGKVVPLRHRESEMNASSGNVGSQSNEPYWLESIPHRGTAAYNGDKSYKVFRNVKARLHFLPLCSGLTDHHFRTSVPREMVSLTILQRSSELIDSVYSISRLIRFSIRNSLAISSGNRCGRGTCPSST